MTSPTHILLVDDDRDDIEVAVRAIRREALDVRVSVANDGEQALAMLGVEGEPEATVRPEVIFLDLKMPRVDGWEVLRRLRACPRTKDVPVIVLSWSDEEADVERCYELGANSFLVKRFTHANPGDYFAQAVRYWTELNHAPPVHDAR